MVVLKIMLGQIIVSGSGNNVRKEKGLFSDLYKLKI